MKLRGLVSMAVFIPAALAAITAGAAELRAYPAQVAIDSTRDPHRLIVIQTRDDGVSMDVTAASEIRIEPSNLAELRGGILHGALNGEGKIIATFGDAAVETPLRVTGAAADPALSFRNDIMPVFMRAGCNAGACHGSASGKNGFHLSLFGYDPANDYSALTREVEGRRLSVPDPAGSLMLLKPTLTVDHEGGERFTPDSELYGTIERWIREGASNDPAPPPALTGIEILPPAVVLEGEDTGMQFIVLAHFADGGDRDVTELSVLSAADDSVIAVDSAGLAKSGRRGETYVMARYGNFAVVSQAIAIPVGATAPAPPQAPGNYIDEFIYAKHANLRIKAAGLCTDEVFVRRVYLDTIGALPSADEARAFLADTDSDKRAKLVDTLLERPEFSDVWAMKWAEVLRVRSSATTLDPKGMYRYNDWLRAAFRENRPIDEIARELLTATGGNFSQPAANFYIIDTEPKTMAENVAQVFMGIQIKCAQCHNHPFERWTMDDYYSFAAFFAQIGKKVSSDPREIIVFNAGGGEVTNLRDGQVMAPKFLGGETPDIAGRDRRAVVAEWLASERNPWFAQNIANRVWAQFMGQGIIEPVDDVRVSNPPSNPALLAELSKRLIEYRYDLRRIIRDICTSNTYQMTTIGDETATNDTRNFAAAKIRRLPAETLLDAISQVTNTQVKFAALPIGARAAQVANGPSGNYFLDVFGRPVRDTACTCERRQEPTLAQVLHLINGNTITEAVQAPQGRVTAAIETSVTTADAVNEVYLAALARQPENDELAELTLYVDTAPDRKAALEDVYWSVLNSKEFVFNH